MGVDWGTTTTVAAQLFRHALQGAAQLALSQYGPAGIRHVSWTSNVSQPAILPSLGPRFFRYDNNWLDILVANATSIRRSTPRNRPAFSRAAPAASQ